jgi:hypothetical protein
VHHGISAVNGPSEAGGPTSNKRASESKENLNSSVLNENTRILASSKEHLVNDGEKKAGGGGK